MLTDEQVHFLEAAAERGLHKDKTLFGRVACDYLAQAVAELLTLRAQQQPGMFTVPEAELRDCISDLEREEDREAWLSRFGLTADAASEGVGEQCTEPA